MKEYKEMHEPWRKNRFVLGPEIVGIITDNGTRKKILGQVAYLHDVINSAMVTSLISYSFKKMERK